MKLGVVYNPTIDDDVLARARVSLDAISDDIIWLETTEGSPGGEQAKQALAVDVEGVVVIGGDGTVRACAEAIVGTDTPMGVVPAGTGNLLARNLGLPMQPEDAVELIGRAYTRVIDTGSVNGETFLVMAGTGLDAVIMDETDSAAKDRFGSLAYVVEAVRHFNDPGLAAEIAVDGRRQAKGSWVTVLIGNLGELQGGVDLFPDSAPDDGELELLALSGETTFERLGAGLAAATHDDDDPRVHRSRGKKFHVELKRPAIFELDGDPRPETEELAVEVVPASLKVFVSEGKG